MHISIEFQDTLLVKLKKRCFRFKDKNKLSKSLKEKKLSFIKIMLLNTTSQNWHGKENYLKKNMKLK